mgnify:CR=1 FL=1
MLALGMGFIDFQKFSCPTAVAHQIKHPTFAKIIANTLVKDPKKRLSAGEVLSILEQDGFVNQGLCNCRK